MSHSQTLPPAVVPVTSTAVPASAAPSAPPSKPKKSRHRNVPLRDENGKLRATFEVAPSSTPDQRARFKSLARMLPHLWFIDQPSPLWVDGKPPGAAVTSVR